MKRIVAALLLSTFMVGIANAQSIQKYLGYYYGDANNPPSTALSEFRSSSNLYHIEFWSTDESAAGRVESTRDLLNELAQAKAAHIHAIIPGYPFLFQQNSANGCFTNDPGAAQSWNSIVQAMVAAGYIDTASPDRSVVTAIYVVDEPNGPHVNGGSNCLPDVAGQPNPALQNAVNAIRANPSTANIPLATILNGSTGFANIASGMQLFDWIGFDNYSDTTSQWQSQLATLKSYAPTKKYILVPGSQSRVIPNECVGTQSPTPFISEFQSDPQAVWLAPFVWFSSGSCLGVRDIPSLRSTYTTLGTSIKVKGCNSSRAAQNFCRPSAVAQLVTTVLFKNTQ